MVNTQSFWDNAHAKQLAANITCSPAEIEINCLNLIDTNSYTDILVVGVGNGNTCKYYESLNKNIDALDISPIALTNVKKYVNHTYLNACELTNKYDLVQAFLVLQHIPNILIDDHFKNIIRSLKDDGIYAFQFIWGNNQKYKYKDDDHRIRAGANFRTPEEMEEIISRNNGKIVYKSETLDTNKPQIWSMIMHVKRVIQ